MRAPIAGRGVIVTDGPTGIGPGVARVFASKGARVMIAARGEADAATAAAESRAAGGVAECVACDVSDGAQAQPMVAAAVSAFGGVDALCANAGVFRRVKPIDMTPEDWDHVMATNLRSAFLCVKACIPGFETAGGGRVALTSSIAGPIAGFPGRARHGASRVGQLGFPRTASMEIARHRATVNAVMPGNIVAEGLACPGEEYFAAMAASMPRARLGRGRPCHRPDHGGGRRRDRPRVAGGDSGGRTDSCNTITYALPAEATRDHAPGDRHARRRRFPRKGRAPASATSRGSTRW
jgi:3-oxoacyl-[acyl-carrier protein] reductase